MEVGLILLAIALQVANTWFLWRESVRGHKKTRESLYRTEVVTGELGELVAKLTISLDNATVIMSDVAKMEERLAKREDVRETQKRLLEMREGGWRGV